MEVIKQLLGRLHPLLVHLPIGFIIFGLLVLWWDRKKKQYQKVIEIVFLWSGIIGIITCISGYFLYTSEGYKWNTIKWHLWFGIATTLFAFLMHFRIQDSKLVVFLKRIPIVALSITLLLLVSSTGHLGGNITHGEDYLTEPLPNGIKKALGIATYEKQEIILDEKNWKGIAVYKQVVQPILNNKCVSCHGPKKAKGGLRLHNQESILNGGESGDIFNKNNPDKSDFLMRLHLPKLDEDHMPPRDKAQLSKQEIAILDAWVQNEHDFKKTTSELGMQKMMFASFFPKTETTNFPQNEVPEVPENELTALHSNQYHVEKISKITNYLSVDCINKPSFSNSNFKDFDNIKEQIAVLDLGGTMVNDSIFESLSTLPNLTILKLDKTQITGNTIEKLAKCAHLKSINLVETNFNDRHLSVLKNIPKLETVFLFGTKISMEAISKFDSPNIKIEYGGYTLDQPETQN